MAGTATFPRGWMLASVLFVMLLTTHNEWPSTSLQSETGKGQLWECPGCLWIEKMPQRRQPPRCRGPAGDEHDELIETRPVEGNGYKPSAGPSRFE
jgi:hypothetical protein